MYKSLGLLLIVAATFVGEQVGGWIYMQTSGPARSPVVAAATSPANHRLETGATVAGPLGSSPPVLRGPIYFYYGNCWYLDADAMRRREELVAMLPTLAKFGFKAVLVVQYHGHYMDPATIAGWWSAPNKLATSLGMTLIPGLQTHQAMWGTKYGRLDCQDDAADVEGAMSDAVVWDPVRTALANIRAAGFTIAWLDDEWWAFDRAVRPAAAAHWTTARLQSTVGQYAQTNQFANGLGLRLFASWQYHHPSFLATDAYRVLADQILDRCAVDGDPMRMVVMVSGQEQVAEHAFARDPQVAAIRCRLASHPGETFCLSSSKWNVGAARGLWPAGRGADGVYHVQDDWRGLMQRAGAWERAVYFGNPAINVPLVAAATATAPATQR